MNAPFKAPPTDTILADACVGISELKKNPSAVIAVAQEQQVAILNRNKPVAYLISAEQWEDTTAMLGRYHALCRQD